MHDYKLQRERQNIIVRVYSCASEGIHKYDLGWTRTESRVEGLTFELLYELNEQIKE